MTAVPQRMQWQPRARANRLLGPQYAASRHTTPQSTTLDLHPVIHVLNYMDHCSFTDPWGMDGWVGHVGWPIADGLTTKWSPRPASSLAQDRDSSPVETSVLNTMLRRQDCRKTDGQTHLRNDLYSAEGKVNTTHLLSHSHVLFFSSFSFTLCIWLCFVFVYRENSPYVRNVLSLSNMVVERGLWVSNIFCYVKLFVRSFIQKSFLHILALIMQSVF